MTFDEEILKELKKISKIITISNGSALQAELTKYATTNERREIWVLIDGKNSTEDIAKAINKTKRTVDTFLSILEQAELIEERKYGVPPVRLIDYVPVEWIQLISKQTEETQTTNETKNEEVKKDG